MKATVTPAAESAITDIAQRHGLSREAVLAMLFAVEAGGGTMAQFAIPELGGSGQWMRGGMTMVGDMFDHTLKARVDALCTELAQLLATTTVFPAPASSAPGAHGGFTAANWWPADLGVPSATGGQNDVRYAVFPATRRLAVHLNGVTRVFDTGDHRIGGVSQQQGGGFGSIVFTSQHGTIDVASLTELGDRQVAETPAAAPTPRHRAPEPAPEATSGAVASGDQAAIIAAIESLAGLHERGILSDDEFAAKKAELLGRL
ncbi:SHOCT domain-containing protein [Mycolicibacterium sp. OfavD-34-C]|uniref:SHOCT domain-containing protein n=1 Tax=Mycolicibacterium sp. OfavD-34-C TaxID=2917746 RepID=UPI001EF4B08C|nr:SHOCT domain-containing protein [Mycolicibacterium sp. OfavD-34-C]MCG7580945.1 SHOCT domain-containing protein [Mycolicibacterium sp. OfavD-34-C]